MLDVYLTSVLIYMIIIYALACVCGSAIINNGWQNRHKPEGNWFVTLFCMSAIPLLRLLFIGVMLYMSIRTPEEFDKWKDELEEKHHDH